MSFRNAIKLLISRFGNVWVLLLYFIVLIAVLVSLGITFLIPVFAAFRDAGVGEMINSAVVSFMNGGSLAGMLSAGKEILRSIAAIFRSDSRAFINSMLFVVLVMNVAFRFLVGLCELPLVSVIQGAMSDNARYGFMGRYIALLRKSAGFSLFKMVVMTAFDLAAGGVVYGFTRLGSMIGLLFGPFMFMLSLLIVLAFRYTLVSGWSPAVIVDGKGVVSGLAYSVRYAFRNFGSLYSNFLVAWTLIFVVNFVIGLFTFFAGLLVTVPLSVYLIDLINMTAYYGKNKKSYYIDGAVVAPKGK